MNIRVFLQGTVDRTLHLWMSCTSPRARRLGCMRALLKRIELEAVNRGLACVSVHTSSTLFPGMFALCQREGYRIVKEWKKDQTGPFHQRFEKQCTTNELK